MEQYHTYAPEQTARPASPLARVRLFFASHGTALWWMHSLYALSLGVFVVMFARKGFDHARWLVLTLSIVWILLVVFYRVAHRDLDTATTGQKVRFLVMTYALKNMYQGMLFFSLPFYWESTTFSAPNRWFVVAIGVCAVLATFDIVFDHFLMKRRWLAVTFYGWTLFAVLNVAIPAMFPRVRTSVTLMAAAACTVIAFASLNMPLRTFVRWRTQALLLPVAALAAALMWLGRVAIPPVPLHLKSWAVSPLLIEGDRPAMAITAIHRSLVPALHGETMVVAPGGSGDELVHVWRHNVEEVDRARVLPIPTDDPNVFSLRSKLRKVPEDPVGNWSIDVETLDGQLVGRATFRVDG